MVVRFNNEYLEQLYTGEPKGKPKYQKQVISKFRKTIKYLRNAASLYEIKQINSLNFEPLKGNLSGYHSVRVGYHYRLILSIVNGEVKVEKILVVEELTNHYQ